MLLVAESSFRVAEPIQGPDVPSHAEMEWIDWDIPTGFGFH
jgi:hypothetical protein